MTVGAEGRGLHGQVMEKRAAQSRPVLCIPELGGAVLTRRKHETIIAAKGDGPDLVLMKQRGIKESAFRRIQETGLLVGPEDDHLAIVAEGSRKDTCGARVGTGEER